MAHLTSLDLRKGMLVDVDGKVCTLIHWNIWKSDRRSKVQMKFKEVLTGRTSEVTAQPDDKYMVLDYEVIELEHSYRDGPELKHNWHSGWVPEAVELLMRSTENP